MNPPSPARRAIVQDILTGRVVASGWITPGQWAKLQRVGVVVLSDDPAAEPAPDGRAWPVTETADLDGTLITFTTAAPDPDGSSDSAPFLQALEATLAARRSSTAQRSYTRALLDAGAPKIGDKLREEASELAQALATESDLRVASEAADVLYHLFVGLCLRSIPFRDVLDVLQKRTGRSGHEEKASRKPDGL